MSTNSEKDAEILTALELASTSFIDGDGYRSTRIHTNAEAAEKLLASEWLAEHDRAVAAAAWDEGWKQGSPMGDSPRITNPYALVTDPAKEN